MYVQDQELKQDHFCVLIKIIYIYVIPINLSYKVYIRHPSPRSFLVRNLQNFNSPLKNLKYIHHNLLENQ
jgi:hypothetical protein